MKKTLFTLAIVLLALAAQAQIKVHDDNWVSIGCLNGDFGLQVTPTNYLYLRTQDSTDYSRANLSMGNAVHQEHWIVQNKYHTDCDCNGKFMFYVYGNGTTFSTRYYTISCSDSCCYASHNVEPVGGDNALSTILGLTANYYEEEPSITPDEIESNENIDREAVAGMIEDLEKRTVGLSVESLVESFPDAIRTDSQARFCIDYNAVVAMLTQAVKQQQEEIELLRKTLEENGLLEPNKH